MYSYNRLSYGVYSPVPFRLKNMFEVQKNIPLKNYSTFKIGGSAKYFVKVSDVFGIKESILWVKKKDIPFFFLGGGSNVLFADGGYNGLIIKIENLGIKFEENNIVVDAGVPFLKLVLSAKEKSLSGLEWAAGIPGTVGGAIFGNAGAFGGEAKDNIKEIVTFDINTLKEKKFKNKDCQFSYRNSIFKKTKKYVLISATFSLEKGNKEKIGEEIKKNIIYRKNHHPLDFPSAGSIFKNVKIKEESFFKRFPEFKQFEKTKEIPAAYLIYLEGLKGKSFGGAKISGKHTNFIVNSGSAKSKDVISLIDFVKNKIKNKFNINLETEIIFVK